MVNLLYEQKEYITLHSFPVVLENSREFKYWKNFKGALLLHVHIVRGWGQRSSA